MGYSLSHRVSVHFISPHLTAVPVLSSQELSVVYRERCSWSAAACGPFHLQTLRRKQRWINTTKSPLRIILLFISPCYLTAVSAPSSDLQTCTHTQTPAILLGSELPHQRGLTGCSLGCVSPWSQSPAPLLPLTRCSSPCSPPAAAGSPGCSPTPCHCRRRVAGHSASSACFGACRQTTWTSMIAVPSPASHTANI